ncbi:MAG TPA: DUF2938 domain-containing protein [Sphingomicrobium sp.]|nr:DUF2938 domain-containing protein [Sphingomicrobium sp.]
MRVVSLGVGATLVMDGWSLGLRRLLGISTLDYRLVGRWVGHFPKGRFTHDPIVQSPPVAGEKWFGWVAHYAIGIGFAWAFSLLMVPDWFDSPTPQPPILFGLVTVLVPFLVMQPALGFGVAASRTPDPLSARLRSLATHAVFGLGLYLSALPLAQFAG